MKDKTVIAQRNTYSVLDCWIVFSFVVFIGWAAFKVSFPKLPVLGISVIANLLLMLSLLSKYRLKRIMLDSSKKKLYIIKDKWFFIQNELEIPLQNVTLKVSTVNRGFGIKVKVFSVFSSIEKIAEAITGVSGWSEDDLRKVQKIIDDNNKP
jgi:hypothetical protein